MAVLKLFWTETAIRQRNYYFEYWNNRNKSNSYSKKLNQKIKERANLLKTNPELGKETEINEIRIVSLGHYSILYKFDSDKVVIVGFWDSRQNPQKLLSFLLRN